jgi:hypothetical protein
MTAPLLPLPELPQQQQTGPPRYPSSDQETAAFIVWARWYGDQE